MFADSLEPSNMTILGEMRSNFSFCLWLGAIPRYSLTHLIGRFNSCLKRDWIEINSAFSSLAGLGRWTWRRESEDVQKVSEPWRRTQPEIPIFGIVLSHLRAVFNRKWVNDHQQQLFLLRFAFDIAYARSSCRTCFPSMALSAFFCC